MGDANLVQTKFLNESWPEDGNTGANDGEIDLENGRDDKSRRIPRRILRRMDAALVGNDKTEAHG